MQQTEAVRCCDLLSPICLQVRVLEKDVLNILQILQAIPEAKVRRMQRALSHVWYR
jgi:hypothetical protein